jgi:hypothetical protein
MVHAGGSRRFPYHLSSTNNTKLLDLSRCQSLARAELAT